MPKKKDEIPVEQRICNVLPSRNVETDWDYQSALAAAAVAAPPAALPPSVDLRAAWWNVGDQEQTGSCVGWASTDGVARYHFVKAGRLGEAEHLSPRFTWMASKETDEFTMRPETFIEVAGTSLKAAVDILKKYGAAPEASLPFHIVTTMYEDRQDPTGDVFFATAAQRRIASYYNLGSDLMAWRAWLAAHGPLMIRLGVDQSWDYPPATGMLDTFQGRIRGGHAATLVGYTADGRFIVRNSWGTNWGDKGFVYINENYIRGGIQAGYYNEAYGIAL